MLWLETTLQQGVRRITDKHFNRASAPFEGNWHPQDQYLWDEFNPKE